MDYTVATLFRHYFFALLIFACALSVRKMASQLVPVLIYQVNEGVSRGTLIGNVKHDWRLSDKYPDDVLNLLRLYITFRDGDVSQRALLALDDVTGVLTIMADLDREWLCNEQGEGCDVLSLFVAVRPLKYFDVIRVDITYTCWMLTTMLPLSQPFNADFSIGA